MTGEHVFGAHAGNPAYAKIFTFPANALVLTRGFILIVVEFALVSAAKGSTSRHINERIFNTETGTAAQGSHKIEFRVVFLEVRKFFINVTKDGVGMHFG